MYRQSEKNLLSSNISSTCPHNMVNFGLLAAEIVSEVWGTPVTFNGFRVLAALLCGRQVVSVSPTLRVEQRVPPMFGRTTIRLGIGPHSSFFFFLMVALCNRADHYIIMLWFVLLLSFFLSNMGGTLCSTRKVWLILTT